MGLAVGRHRRLSARVRWALFALALFVTEVLIATVWKHVPFVRADLGDFLVVILLYACAKAVRPQLARTPLTIGIFVFAALLEFGQGLGLADRLGLAPGSVMRIVVGTTFQWTDLAMYFAGCLTAWVLDRSR